MNVTGIMYFFFGEKQILCLSESYVCSTAEKKQKVFFWFWKCVVILLNMYVLCTWDDETQKKIHENQIMSGKNFK